MRRLDALLLLSLLGPWAKADPAGGVPVATSGELSSPGYPGSYPSDHNSEEEIDAGPGNIVLVHFTDLDIENSTNCEHDSLRIEEGDGAELLAPTCGRLLPLDLRSRAQRVKVVFSTDTSISGRGWRITWTTAPATTAPVTLMDLGSSSDRMGPPPSCCSGPVIAACHSSLVNSTIVTTRTPLRLPGTTEAFLFLDTVEPNGFQYRTASGDDAIFTVNPENGVMFGTMQANGKSFSLNPCESEYIWIEYDFENFHEKEDGDHHLQDTIGMSQDNIVPAIDNTTLIEFTVMVYYTRKFEKKEKNILGFVNQLLAMTNLGYKNSRVPMRISLHCIEAATIEETDQSSTLTNFMMMKTAGSLVPTASGAALRQSADTAILLVDAFTNPHDCGKAYQYDINTIDTGLTISVCARQCALWNFSFGHEIAHTIGAYHNKETHGQNPFYPNAHGHLIKKGTDVTGRRSVMAYQRIDHLMRVNYYSNPAVQFPDTKTPTGTADSNNAAVLLRNRVALSQVGDESNVSCKT